MNDDLFCDMIGKHNVWIEVESAKNVKSAYWEVEFVRRVAVIGGGAAGMMAAIAAARNGAAVALYEKNDRVGKKILTTGNGKCNFSNQDFSVNYYYGNGRRGVDYHKLKHFFWQFSAEDTVLFFEEAGMLVKEKRGYLYPWSEQASTVLDILRLELDRLKVEIRFSGKIKEIGVNEGIKGADEENGKFILKPFERDGCYHAVIIACGGCAAPKTGSDGSGYELAMRLGHRIVPTVPALVQLRCSDDFFRMVSGVRCEAGLTLYAGEENKNERNNRTQDKNRLGRVGERDEWNVRIQEENGELQFTDYGISGIPVFQLSRQAAYLLKEKKPVTVSIDLFPYIERQEFKKMCERRLHHGKGRTVEEWLLGMANKKVNLLMIKLAGLKPNENVEDISIKRLKKLLFSYRELQVHVEDTNSFEHAQVTAGGVDMAEVSDCLSSVKIPGVYFAGEVLDVDGRCGGYNLQWAWTSGYTAGKYAALGDGK